MQKPNMPLTVVKHSLFHKHREADGTLALVAEASDLKGLDLERRLWDDACDVGFAIDGLKGQVVFYSERDEYNADRDLVATHFKPVDWYVRKNPALAKVRVVIYND